MSRDQWTAARSADLFAYLLAVHPGDFSLESGSLRMRRNHSISIKRGYSGFRDFATGETGNSIDFLTRHLGYSFNDAVAALLGYSTAPVPKAMHRAGEADPLRLLALPVRKRGFPEEALAYLSQRGIPLPLSRTLVRRGLLYQSLEKNNLVFLNIQKDFAELRGTMPGSRFHGIRRTSPDRFWGFSPFPEMQAECAFICEGAIDAISLFLLHCLCGTAPRAIYCGIGGVSNQKAIDRISRYWTPTIAVDNDAAGEECRRRNKGKTSLVPGEKDWNEDLLKILPGLTDDYVDECVSRNLPLNE